MTPSGIEPATFRFVAQYLNHCATISGPPLVGTVRIYKTLGPVYEKPTGRFGKGQLL
jgi:hypothetical protein